MPGPDPRLAADFPAADEAAWRALAEAALKGALFEKKLFVRTADGLALPALARRATGRAPLTGRAAPWHAVARMDMPDASAANAQALEDLNNGASGLALVTSGAPTAYGFGLHIASLDDLDRALEDVRLDLIHTRLEAGADAPEKAVLLLELVQKRGLEAPDISLGLDPLAGAVPSGLFTVPGIRVLRADGRLAHMAGASATQELAAALATVLAGVRLLGDILSAPEALGRIDVTLAADADQFETIAKMRAMRLLWRALARELGAPDVPLHLHAETAWRMLTRRDVHVNLLRNTIAAFAAGIGGADSVTVLPFTQALGLPDGFARRLARNTQTIIVEESNLARVADPAAGSGTVEGFTDALAEGAWNLFCEIERRGGMAEARSSGWWPAEVARVRETRLSGIATRKAPITGVSEFPLLDEKDVAVLAPLPAHGGFERLSEPYERLRDAADACPVRPKVFLATLGNLAAFTPRASFAQNLFAAGGLGVAGGTAFADAAALAAAFTASGARLACLCGADAVYAEHGAEAARALREAGATVWLAGKPEAALAQAGVTGFIFAGCDALKALADAHHITGVSA